MSQFVLVLNAGSSSLKFSIHAAEQAKLVRRAEGTIAWADEKASLAASTSNGEIKRDLGHCDYTEAVEAINAWYKEESLCADCRAVGHRIVHGGSDFCSPLVVDDIAVVRLREMVPLAPLHQPLCLDVLEKARKVFGDVPHIACFDTSFHNTQPRVAKAVPLPQYLSAKGIRRFGFHGLSYEYIASKLLEVAPRLASGKVIVAHLGSGASLCALQGGTSVATTMGFSALDGLMMGTRCGSIDPGILLYLLKYLGFSPHELEELLYKKSGLLGVSELSADLRLLLAASDSRAQEAIDLYVYRIVREVGSLVAALGGVDGIVFTAGVGERSFEIRARVCEQLAWLGCSLDPDANIRNAQRISTTQSRLEVLVIPTDENLVIAQHCIDLVS